VRGGDERGKKVAEAVFDEGGVARVEGKRRVDIFELRNERVSEVSHDARGSGTFLVVWSGICSRPHECLLRELCWSQVSVTLHVKWLAGAIYLQLKRHIFNATSTKTFQNKWYSRGGGPLAYDGALEFVGFADTTLTSSVLCSFLMLLL